MKNLMLSCIPLLMLTTCSPEPVEDAYDLKPALIGKWELEERLLGTNTVNLNACDQQNTFEFTEDGSVTDHVYTEVEEGCGEISTIGKYSVKESFLTLTFGSTPFEETILEVTENSLVLLDNDQYKSTYKRVK